MTLPPEEAIAWCVERSGDAMWDARYAEMRLVTVYVRHDGQSSKTAALDEGGMLDALVEAVEHHVAQGR